LIENLVQPFCLFNRYRVHFYLRLVLLEMIYPFIGFLGR
jgi:hypothetical protein